MGICVDFWLIGYHWYGPSQGVGTLLDEARGAGLNPLDSLYTLSVST